MSYLERGNKMDEGVRLELTLDGLDCANCGAKIEKKVNGIENVKHAFLNFASKTLIIEVSDKENTSDILYKTKSIVSSIDPDVVVKEKDNEANRFEDESGDERDIKEKVISICLSAVLLLAAMFLKLSLPAEVILYTISYLLVGGRVLLKSAKNILKGRIFDENFLMSIATIGAFSIKEFAEGVSVMLFYNIGMLLQNLAVDNSRRSIKSLMDIRPDYANQYINGKTVKVSPTEVKIGDLIVIKPGEKVPLDGNIIEGNSMVDTSALTGESVPRELVPGDDILSGFINENGLLKVKVTKEYGESTAAKILYMVQNAGANKAKTESFITRFAMYYTPAVVISAALLTVIPAIIYRGSNFSAYLYRSLVFLVVSCPCALVISIPLSFFGGIGGASKKGILIKGGNYLEALEKVDTMVFDKTGTLTKGVFKVTQINEHGQISRDEMLEYAATCENYSSHPIAASILNAYGREVDTSSIESYQELPGFGVKSRIKGREVIVGNEKLMRSEGIEFKDDGCLGTIVHIAIDGRYEGNIVISDEIKDDSYHAIQKIKDAGVKKAVMLTGDSIEVANAIGGKLGIDEVYGGLLPNEKVEKLETIKQNISDGSVVFVGDGINDAPVLARADVGIAMGGLGSDAAIEAADVVIMTDEPSKISDAIKIAKYTKKIAMQNIILALGVKAVVLVLGAFGDAAMWEAVFADVGVAVIAVLNSMRTINVK